jgi:hypothetical protein
MTVKKKRVIKKRKLVAKQQFTFRGKLYKVGSPIKASENEVKTLINKNLIKWQ